MIATLAWAGFAVLIILGVLLVSTGVSLILDALLWGQDTSPGAFATILGMMLLALALAVGPFTVVIKEFS